MALLPAVDSPAFIQHPAKWRLMANIFLHQFGPSTREAYNQDLVSFFTFCLDNGVDPLSATRGACDAFSRHLEEVEKLAPATRARRLTAVSGYFSYALDEEVIHKNPMASVKRPRVSKESQALGLTKEQYFEIEKYAFDHFGPNEASLIALLGMNGLRVTEAIEARIEDLHQVRDKAVLKITRKGGKIVDVPLAPTTKNKVFLAIAGRSHGTVLMNEDVPFTRFTAYNTIKKIVKAVYPDIYHQISPHSFRHTFATLSLDAGVPIERLREAMSHSDVRTTLRYEHTMKSLDNHPTFTLERHVHEVQPQ